MTLPPASMQTVGLLILSNLFMTFAWYGHLKDLTHKPWLIAALVSWGIALFEYLLQVPANRIGFASGISLLKFSKIMTNTSPFALSLSKCRTEECAGLDRLSPNGVGCRD
jgi:uncharacterized protein (DUF486 family)